MMDLAKARFDWGRIHPFWVDERGVPPTGQQSNYKLAKEHLIDPAGFPENNLHRIQAELESKTAARPTEKRLASYGVIPVDIVNTGPRLASSRSSL